MDILRTGTGLPGLDEILHGGLPTGRTYLLHGASGAGKTTFGLRFLLEGARRGERCPLLSNTETPNEIDAFVRSHGWDLAAELRRLLAQAAATARQHHSSRFPPEAISRAERDSSDSQLRSPREEPETPSQSPEDRSSGRTESQ